MSPFGPIEAANAYLPTYLIEGINVTKVPFQLCSDTDTLKIYI